MTRFICLFLTIGYFSCGSDFKLTEKSDGAGTATMDIKKTRLCEKIELSDNLQLYDTLEINNMIRIIISDVLARPVEGSLFLVYEDTIQQVFDENPFTEHVWTVQRNIPLQQVQ